MADRRFALHFDLALKGSVVLVSMDTFLELVIFLGTEKLWGHKVLWYE